MSAGVGIGSGARTTRSPGKIREQRRVERVGRDAERRGHVRDDGGARRVGGRRRAEQRAAHRDRRKRAALAA